MIGRGDHSLTSLIRATHTPLETNGTDFSLFNYGEVGTRGCLIVINKRVHNQACGVTINQLQALRRRMVCKRILKSACPNFDSQMRKNPNGRTRDLVIIVLSEFTTAGMKLNDRLSKAHLLKALPIVVHADSGVHPGQSWRLIDHNLNQRFCRDILLTACQHVSKSCTRCCAGCILVGNLPENQLRDPCSCSSSEISRVQPASTQMSIPCIDLQRSAVHGAASISQPTPSNSHMVVGSTDVEPPHECCRRDYSAQNGNNKRGNPMDVSEENVAALQTMVGSSTMAKVKQVLRQGLRVEIVLEGNITANGWCPAWALKDAEDTVHHMDVGATYQSIDLSFHLPEQSILSECIPCYRIGSRKLPDHHRNLWFCTWSRSLSELYDASLISQSKDIMKGIAVSTLIFIPNSPTPEPQNYMNTLTTYQVDDPLLVTIARVEKTGSYTATAAVHAPRLKWICNPLHSSPCCKHHSITTVYNEQYVAIRMKLCEVCLWDDVTSLTPTRECTNTTAFKNMDPARPILVGPFECVNHHPSSTTSRTSPATASSKDELTKPAALRMVKYHHVNSKAELDSMMHVAHYYGMCLAHVIGVIVILLYRWSYPMQCSKNARRKPTIGCDTSTSREKRCSRRGALEHKIYFNGNRFRSRVRLMRGKNRCTQYGPAGIQCAHHATSDRSASTPFSKQGTTVVDFKWRGGQYEHTARIKLQIHNWKSLYPHSHHAYFQGTASQASKLPAGSQWLHDLCEDGDIESNPGPPNSLPGQVSCRVASFRKHAEKPTPSLGHALEEIMYNDTHIAAVFEKVCNLPDAITISIHNPDGLQNNSNSGKTWKLDDPDFLANYDSSDIVIIPESHSDILYSESRISGWTIVNAPRVIRHADDFNRKASTSSGGVMVLISNTIVDGIDISGVQRLEGVCSVPLKPSFRVSREGKPIILLGIYAPPQSSKFVKNMKGRQGGDVLSTVDSEIRKWKKNGFDVICGGDFNSYITRGCEYFNAADLMNYAQTEFSTDGLKIDRLKAEDNGSNAHGKKLNNTLTRHDMVAVNGLTICGSHVGDGAPTHYGRQHGSATCIDLFCVSLGLLQHEIALKVMPSGGSDGSSDWGHRIVTLAVNLDSPEKSVPCSSDNAKRGDPIARPKVKIFEQHLQNQNAIDAMGEQISNTKSLISWCHELARTDPEHWTPDLLGMQADKLAQAIYEGVRSSQCGTVKHSKSVPRADNLKTRTDKRSKIERKLHDKACKNVAVDDTVQALRKQMNNCVKRVHKIKRHISQHRGENIELQDELAKAIPKMRQATSLYKLKKKELLDLELQKEFESWVIGVKVKPLETWKVLKSLLRNSGDASNPIDGPTWVKHFQRIYVDGKIGDAPHPQSISEEIEKWEHFLSCPELRNEIYGLGSCPNQLDQCISLEETASAVKRLNAAASAGIDGLDGRIIKSVLKNPQMIGAMHTLCDLIYQNKCIPTNWVRAKLIALKKPGKCKTDPDGYRGIAILNVIGKVYGIIIEEKLYRAVNIPEEQVGAIRNLSTTDACVALRTLVEKYAWNWGAMNPNKKSIPARSPVVTNFINQNFSSNAQGQIMQNIAQNDPPW